MTQTTLRLDSAGLAVMLQKLFQAWCIHQALTEEQGGPTAAFIEEWLEGQEVVITSAPPSR